MQPKECSKIFSFKSVNNNNPSIDNWANFVKLHIKESYGQQENLIKLAKIKRFWRVFSIIKFFIFGNLE